jgi:hypothetical protein
MHPQLEQTAYKVGRRLQEESHSQFIEVFQHILNVNPRDTNSVKELQKTLNHAEELRLTHAEDRKTLRKGIITIALGWLTSMIALVWSIFHTKGG